MLYDIMTSDLGPIFFSRDDIGINRVHFRHSSHPMPLDDSWRRERRDPLLCEAHRQLEAYLAGKLQHFSLPLSFDGTDFQTRVWEGLCAIPYGQTWSYSQLAAFIGNPTGCRAVGNANGKNKLPIIVPCHRVIGADGKLVGFASGLEIKKHLLNLEKSFSSKIRQGHAELH